MKPRPGITCQASYLSAMLSPTAAAEELPDEESLEMMYEWSGMVDSFMNEQNEEMTIREWKTEVICIFHHMSYGKL